MQSPHLPDEEGFALVTTILIILVLSILAVSVAWVASQEKKCSFAEGVHIESLLAADAGSEAGINFLRLVESPPAATGAGGQIMSTGIIPLHESQTFEFDCSYVGRSFRPGWGTEYPDFEYQIKSTGHASRDGRGHVKVLVSRLFKLGY